MNMNRKPNCECALCGDGIYRRPKDIEKFTNVYCSRICYGKFNRKDKICEFCKKPYKSNESESKFCSRSCSNKNRAGIKYNKDCKNRSQFRLKLLREKFKFTCCMVEGCKYNKTFDIHRLVPGKEGGKYEVGNMYAICPNHHAEVTRGIIVLKKKTDYLLCIQ